MPDHHPHHPAAENDTCFQVACYELLDRHALVDFVAALPPHVRHVGVLHASRQPDAVEALDRLAGRRADWNEPVHVATCFVPDPCL